MLKERSLHAVNEHLNRTRAREIFNAELVQQGFFQQPARVLIALEHKQDLEYFQTFYIELLTRSFHEKRLPELLPELSPELSLELLPEPSPEPLPKPSPKPSPKFLPERLREQ